MLKVKDIMNKHIVTVMTDTGVKGVCQALIKNRLSGVPVLDKKSKLAGFVSERDIIAAVNQKDFLKKKVKDIMSKKVCSVTENMFTEELSGIFTEYPFRYLPVERGGRVVGIVTRREVIEKLLGQYY